MISKEEITKEVFLSAYNNAKSTKVLMDKFGMTHFRIAALCRKYEVEKPIGKRGVKKRIRLTKKDITEHYLSKKSTRAEAAAKLGISRLSFDREFNRVFPNHVDEKRNRPAFAIYLLEKKGLTVRQVAERLGVNTVTVYRWRKNRRKGVES